MNTPLQNSNPHQRANSQDIIAPGDVRIRLQIAYDGTGFEGWQSQPHGRAVQDALERALVDILGRRIVVQGSGRTDAGVHALGQVAHIDVPAGRLTPEGWMGAINARLVPTARIVCAKKAASGFHARFSATGKIYTYRVWNHRILLPTEINRVWHSTIPVDRTKLRATAQLLEGTHDFAPFSAKRHAGENNTIRTLRRIQISTAGPLLTLRFEGSGFLYRMVRILTGSMLRVAQGKADIEWLAELLRNPNGRRSSFCAVAEGLYLTRVLYGKKVRVLTEEPHLPQP